MWFFAFEGVGISIIERPGPLHNHDALNLARHPHTLKCVDPDFLDWLHKCDRYKKYFTVCESKLFGQVWTKDVSAGLSRSDKM